jgi:hypothetical protein
MAVCDHLRLRAKPDVLWLHPPNGERRDSITGAKLKRMGTLAGTSDLRSTDRRAAGFPRALQ